LQFKIYHVKYQYHILKNGIKIIHRQTEGKVSHCGIMVNTGSRDECEDENGLAHLIEHMLFKGTNKRKAHHVLSRIENIGGELNAYTTKEETCIYASFMPNYYKQSIELFADVAFNSVYPQKEIAKEKDIIIDEINSYNDSPAELIFDDFEDLIYNGHSLGRNILGSIENIKSLKRKDILRFIKTKYSTEEMVIASVGQIDFKKLISIIEKYFNDIPQTRSSLTRIPFNNYIPTNHVKSMNSHLSHCMLGNIAYSRSHSNKLTLLLISNLLGGPALNSTLSMEIREKHALAYSVESMFQPYSDTGVFNIYIGSDINYVDKSINLALKVLARMRNKKLGTMQLHRAKRQIVGQLAMSSESYQNEMLGIAKVLLYKSRVKTIEEVIDEIGNITADQILDVSNEIFDSKKMSILRYLNE
jgi:predicted Zn-dependent peptidase